MLIDHSGDDRSNLNDKGLNSIEVPDWAKTKWKDFNCSAEDLFRLISDKFRMVGKVDGNSSLIHVIGTCTRAALSQYSWPRILFHKINYLIFGFPDSGMRRHADKFRQKCQIENARHNVIKRERIGLNWFKIFQSFSMKSKAWRSMLGSDIVQAR